MSGKCRKIISMLILTVLLSMLLFSLYGCTKTPEDYTLDEHMKNISKRIEEKYLQDGETYNVYPVYTQNDVLKYFLVEFSTDRCIFIMVRETDFEFRLLNGKYSIYAPDKYIAWNRYRREENLEKETYGVSIIWSSEKVDGVYYEADANGEKIEYKRSPYSIANVLQEKKYLIEIGEHEAIPAVKTGNSTYLNLVSMIEFEISSDLTTQEIFSLYFVLGPHHHL
ncbi:MAG: hypothetical protein ACI4MZ_04390 [Christensenellales bacterium]